MARSQIIIRRHRRPSSSGRIAAEVAGGTAAECAAVWCCGPCAVVNLIVLAVYKVPAGLCRKAIRHRRRRRMMKKGLWPVASSAERQSFEWDETAAFTKEYDDVTVVVLGGSEMELEMDVELRELEKEMWDRFYGTGFWRSASQREQ